MCEACVSFEFFFISTCSLHNTITIMLVNENLDHRDLAAMNDELQLGLLQP